MRLINLSFALLFSLLLNAQFKPEWVKKLPWNLQHTNEHITGLIYFDNSVAVLKKESSILKFNSNGNSAFTYSTVNEWGNSLQLYKGKIFSLGNAVTSLDLNGQTIDKIILKYPNSTSDLIFTNGVISNNNVYGAAIGGGAEIFKYDLQGNKIWFKKIASSSGTIVRFQMADNSIYLYGSFYDPQPSLRKYDTLGDLVWAIEPDVFLDNFVLDNDGNCYLLGSSLQLQNYIVKLNKHGHLVWKKPHSPAKFKNGSIKGDSLIVSGGVGLKECFYSIVSASTGEVHETNIFDLFPDQAESHEYLTEIYAAEDAIYGAGHYQSQNATAFVVKFGDPRFIGIKERDRNADIQVYPNPSSSEFNLKIRNTKDADVIISIAVRNCLGQIVYCRTQHGFTESSNFKINLVDQQPGVFVAEVVIASDKYKIKLVRN